MARRPKSSRNEMAASNAASARDRRSSAPSAHDRFIASILSEPSSFRSVGSLTSAPLSASSQAPSEPVSLKRRERPDLSPDRVKTDPLASALRDEEAGVCKPRPRGGKGSGRSRPFIPWCKRG